MEFSFWIVRNGDLVEVSKDEFYAFEGEKHLFPKNRGPGWFIGTAMLCDLAGREIHSVPSFLNRFVDWQ